MLSKEMHPSLCFYKIANEIPQTHGKKGIVEGKKICGSSK